MGRKIDQNVSIPGKSGVGDGAAHGETMLKNISGYKFDVQELQKYANKMVKKRIKPGRHFYLAKI